MINPPDIETKIKIALDSMGIKIGDEIPAEIRWRIGSETTEGMTATAAAVAFYRAWDDLTRNSPPPTIRIA